MRFMKDDKLVCIQEGMWDNPIAGKNDYGPKYGDLVTVTGIDYEDPEYIFLLEWPTFRNGQRCSWHEKHFAPLQDISELTEILKHETIEV